MSPWWPKIELKNYSTTVDKSYKKPQIKKFYKTESLKVGILIQNTISKFSKNNNQTKQRPPKVPKNQNIYKEASNQNVV